jgi:hypothetical protein
MSESPCFTCCVPSTHIKAPSAWQHNPSTNLTALLLPYLLHTPTQLPQACLLENLRFHSGEATSDPAFAQQLAALGDVYVNDAFGVAHREQASVTVSVINMLT